ncbi:hypothetical protein ACXN5S_13440 [Pseudoroseicyclus sp. H15]
MSDKPQPDAAALAGQDEEVVVTELRTISDDAPEALTEGEIEELAAFYTALPPIADTGEAR